MSDEQFQDFHPCLPFFFPIPAHLFSSPSPLTSFLHYTHSHFLPLPLLPFCFPAQHGLPLPLLPFCFPSHIFSPSLLTFSSPSPLTFSFLPLLSFCFPSHISSPFPAHIFFPFHPFIPLQPPHPSYFSSLLFGLSHLSFFLPSFSPSFFLPLFLFFPSQICFPHVKTFPGLWGGNLKIIHPCNKHLSILAFSFETQTPMR